MPNQSFIQQPSFQLKDRTEAGRVLGGILSTHADDHDLLILALPRGGVPVGFEVSCALNAPLDVFLVRKLGVPRQPELAMGAISSGGVRTLNQDVIGAYGVSREELERVTNRERAELQRREEAYHGSQAPIRMADRTVILVDDGLATGSTMLAAVRAARVQRPRKIVVAVPVASVEGCAAVAPEVDRLVCAFTPTPFFSVGRWYQDFYPTMDSEVRDLLLARSILGIAVTKESSDGHAHHRAARPARGF